MGQGPRRDLLYDRLATRATPGANASQRRYSDWGTRLASIVLRPLFSMSLMLAS
jgi:hypothetical protein